MKRQFQWNPSQPSQNMPDSQQADPPHGPSSIVDADTASLAAINNVPPAGTPDLSQFHQYAQKSIPPMNPVVDVDTVSLAAISSVPPAEVPDHSQFHQYAQKSTPPMNPIVRQNTMRPGSTHGSPSTDVHKIQTQSNPPGAIQHMINAVRSRLQDPQPEGLLTRGLQTVRPETRLGGFPVLTLTTAFGLLITSFSYYLSVKQYPYASVEAVFFAGLLLMFVPNLVRLLSRVPSRLERICLLCVLGITAYFVQFTTSPFIFRNTTNLCIYVQRMIFLTVVISLV
jgi:hypothetical protein